MRYFDHANSFRMKLNPAPTAQVERFRYTPSVLGSDSMSLTDRLRKYEEMVPAYKAAGFTCNGNYRWSKFMTAEEAAQVPFQVERMN